MRSCGLIPISATPDPGQSHMNLKVGPFDISPGGRTLVIAEAGVNHNGDLELAKQLVKAASAAGADCVKFQTFRADQLAMQSAPKAMYQRHTTDAGESQLQMLRRLELPREDYPQLARLCHDQQIIFLSTPYSCEDVDFLDSLGVAAYKVASGQAVEPVFLEHVARKGKPILLSTGMCTFAEVDRAVQTIRQAGNDQILVLQCTTSYPAAINDANLLAMTHMGHQLEVLVGYSDHTQSLTAATVAVGLGACVIERHLTIDKTLPGPDQSCSSDPDQFALLVRTIREAQQALGSAEKKPSQAERQNLTVIRRGLVAATRIPSGTRFTRHNVAVRRPVTSLSGQHLPMVLDRHAAVDIAADTPITLEMIR